MTLVVDAMERKIQLSEQHGLAKRSVSESNSIRERGNASQGPALLK